MKPFPVLPFSGTRLVSWSASGAVSVSNALLPAHAGPAAAKVRFLAPDWVETTTASLRPVLRLADPGDQMENQGDDDDDSELEKDEDPNKLDIARARPGAEEGSLAARGDGTINPPFP